MKAKFIRIDLVDYHSKHEINRCRVSRNVAPLNLNSLKTTKTLSHIESMSSFLSSVGILNWESASSSLVKVFHSKFINGIPSHPILIEFKV